MGRHSVFMLILEFLDLKGDFYIPGRVTMSTLRIYVCRQTNLTSTPKVINRYLRFIHIWNKQVMELKIILRKFRIFEKNIGEESKFMK